MNIVCVVIVILRFSIAFSTDMLILIFPRVIQFFRVVIQVSFEKAREERGRNKKKLTAFLTSSISRNFKLYDRKY